MKRLQPVIWSKGTFLSPQHLQLQDRFHENLLQFQLDNLAFRPWGFRSLTIAQEPLGAGAFGIASASGIFADGLLFDIPASDAAPPLKQLAECFEPDQTSLDLYLAVPQYRERGLNVATSARDGGARYRAEIEVFRDENTGLAEKSGAGRAQEFAAAGGRRELATATPALRVARVRANRGRFVPTGPRLRPAAGGFAASEYLVSIARRLVEILTARSSAISGMRRQKNQSLADFTAADIANFWLLYTVNTAFPVFRHLFETRRGHPEDAVQRDALAGRGAVHVFHCHPPPRPARLRSRQPGRLLHRAGREAAHCCSKPWCRPTSCRCR